MQLSSSVLLTGTGNHASSYLQHYVSIIVIVIKLYISQPHSKHLDFLFCLLGNVQHSYVKPHICNFFFFRIKQSTCNIVWYKLHIGKQTWCGSSKNLPMHKPDWVGTEIVWLVPNVFSIAQSASFLGSGSEEEPAEIAILVVRERWILGGMWWSMLNPSNVNAGHGCWNSGVACIYSWLTFAWTLLSVLIISSLLTSSKWRCFIYPLA